MPEILQWSVWNLLEIRNDVLDMGQVGRGEDGVAEEAG